MQEESIPTYFRTLISNPSLALQGHAALLSKMSKDESFVRSIIEHLSSGQQRIQSQPEQYFEIITLAHPALIQTFPKMSEGLQEDIRGGLLNVVVALHPNLKCISALALLIREIIEIDSLDPWLEPLGELLKWVASDQLPNMVAGIQFFVFLLKETNYNKPNSELPIHKLSPLLLQNLYQIFAHSELTEKIREKLLYLVLQLIKTFSIYDGSEDEVVRQCFDGTFQIWMSLFVSTLQSSLQSNINIKKYILKIIVIIFRDMQKYITSKGHEQIKVLTVIWEFAYKILPLYLWSHVWERPVSHFSPNADSKKQHPKIIANQEFSYYDDDNDALIPPLESLAHSILEFISVLTSIPLLHNTIKLSIHHLTNVLFHYMLMTEFDSLNWKYNPHHFTQQSNLMDYQLTIRNKIIAILNDFIEKFQDYAIQAILVISEKFLLNLSEEETTKNIITILKNVVDFDKVVEITAGIYPSENKFLHFVKLSSCEVKESMSLSGESWRKLQVALAILGRFSEDIIVFQSKQSGAFDIQAFVKGMINQIKDEEYFSLLKGQSLFCLTRFTQIISIKYRELFSELTTASIFCLQDHHPISVRIMACKSLMIFLKKMEKHKLQFSSEQIQTISQIEPINRIMAIPLSQEVHNQILQGLIELSKNYQLKKHISPPTPEYLLAIFHKSITQPHLLQLVFNLLESILNDSDMFISITEIFVNFISQCLKAYNNIVKSEQKKNLKSLDTELILTVLRAINILVDKSITHAQCRSQKVLILSLLPTVTQILENNEDVQIQVAITIYLKSVIKSSSQLILQQKQSIQKIVNSIRILLRIPTDKSFESASIYAGNLTVLVFEKLLKKNNYEILQEVVLKVFKSRTPSVIQSLVLIYAKLINWLTNSDNKFNICGETESNIRNLIDFLSSFSIENRMGLKILIDKWLLQQSLFRGKYTKISTFMALSKLFLIADKRVDNLLVIGFNPSHTNVSNDVNAPLKILATLIRCLDNQIGGNKNQQDDQENMDYALKEDQPNTLDVGLEKFKEDKVESEEQKVSGGLADRQNQQGSTCYMSAMLQFYDDGEECDDKTEEDLIYLKDTSTQFQLGEYLTDFFEYLNTNRKEYFRECMKGLLKEDMKTLAKYVQIQ